MDLSFSVRVRKSRETSTWKFHVEISLMSSLQQLSPLAPAGAFPCVSPSNPGLSPSPTRVPQGYALPHHEVRHRPYADPPSRIMDPSKGIPGCAPYPVNSHPTDSLVATPDGLMYTNPSLMKLHPGTGVPMSMNPSMCVMSPYDVHGSYQYLSQAYASLDPRRKNATKESTNTLKAWLYEHKKNPYPTKGEKIMLAILTRMTLTQVSTWFANARRRLKKERGGWTGEDDEEEDVEVEEEEEEEEAGGGDRLKADVSSPSPRHSSHGLVPITPPPSPPVQDRLTAPTRPSKPHTIDHLPDRPQPAEPAKKPVIWSIADMVQSKSDRRRDPTSPNVTVTSWSARDVSHRPYPYPYASGVRQNLLQHSMIPADPRLTHAHRQPSVIIPSNMR